MIHTRTHGVTPVKTLPMNFFRFDNIYFSLGDVNGTLALTSMFFPHYFSDNKVDWSRDQNETGESDILFEWEPTFQKIE